MEQGGRYKKGDGCCRVFILLKFELNLPNLIWHRGGKHVNDREA
jgi:hypothetical protein